MQDKQEIEYSAETVKRDQEHQLEFAKKVMRILCQILLFLCLVIGFWNNIINAKIPSESMEPTIMTGDRIFGWKHAYDGEKSPERYDIVIFKRAGTDTFLIKRVIGLPGDTLEFREDGVYANGERLDDSFTQGVTTAGDLPQTVLQIPDGCYFVMGDNRECSFDSRYWTTQEGFADPYITDSEIVAEAAFTYFPFDRIGKIE